MDIQSILLVTIVFLAATAACVILFQRLGFGAILGFIVAGIVIGPFVLGLIGAFAAHRWWAVVAATGVIIAALYLLWAYQRVFHGPAEGDGARSPGPGRWQLGRRRGPRRAGVHPGRPGRR